MAIEEQTGRIVRSISGFYDVVLPTGTVTRLLAKALVEEASQE